MRANSALWRVAFFLCAVLIAIGGPQHPSGTMPQMLANPKWVPAHALMLAGFVALLAGLILLARQALPSASRRWVRVAVIATALQAIEMAMHTAAALDAANLVAGRATPILSTHLALAAVVYPFFGVAMIAFILAATRDRVVGSRWIAWIGILGAAAHGAAAPLVVLFHVSRAAALFPLLMLLALWLLLAAIWPVKSTANAAAEQVAV